MSISKKWGDYATICKHNRPTSGYIKTPFCTKMCLIIPSTNRIASIPTTIHRM